MKLKISTTRTQDNIDKCLGVLEDSPRVFQNLAHLTEEQLNMPLADGKRSIKETLVHILNCDALTYEHVSLALVKKTPKIIRVHAEREFGSVINLGALLYDDLVMYYTLRRKFLISILSSLNDEDWDRDIEEEGKQRKETIYRLLRALSLHEEEHARTTRERAAVMIIDST